MNSFTEENYLKAIYKIAEGGDDLITTCDIARHLHTTPASVTDMLKKLARKKLIRYKKYNGLTLSEAGRKTALEIVRKHRLWEMFLVKTLKFKWDEVHEVAEQLEHIRSAHLIQQIDRILHYPKVDPHGDLIPDASGRFAEQKQKSLRLSEGSEEKKYLITGVTDHSNSFLQLLEKSRLLPGSGIKIKLIQPYDRSLSVLLNGKKHLYVSNQVAKNILVAQTYARKRRAS